MCERAFCLFKPDSLRVLRRENRQEDCDSTQVEVNLCSVYDVSIMYVLNKVCVGEKTVQFDTTENCECMTQTEGE